MTELFAPRPKELQHYGTVVQEGITNSLDAKLENVLGALSAAKASSAVSTCNQLDAFINETQAQSSKKLTVDQASRVGGRIARYSVSAALSASPQPRSE